MKQITYQRIKYAVSDLVTVAVGWFCFNVLRFFTLPPDLVQTSLSGFLLSRPLVLGQLVVPPCMLVLYAISGSYNRSNTLYKSRLDEVLNTFIVSFIGMLGIFFAALVNDNIPERVTNYELMLMLLGCLFIPTAVARLVIVTRNAARIRRGAYSMKTLVIGAAPSLSTKLDRIISSRINTGLHVVGCVDIDGTAEGDTLDGVPVYRTDDIAGLCRSAGIQAIIVMPQEGGLSQVGEIINDLYALDLPLFVTPDLHSLMTTKPRLTSVTTEPLVDITNANIPPVAVNLKRIADVVTSALALVVLSPVMLALAIIVKLDSPGPVFYTQRRIGYHKKPFMIVKFRTMMVNAEANGPVLATEHDPRVTRSGHVMRKYRLDELPQFWNVLKGEMSIVGPRPERDYYIRQLLDRHPAYSLIHQVRPGITSWGVVKFGYASNIDEMMERLYYDMLYLENVSLAVDLKIIFHTVNTVIRGRGK